jgi:hypothetical protein
MLKCGFFAGLTLMWVLPATWPEANGFLSLRAASPYFAGVLVIGSMILAPRFI